MKKLSPYNAAFERLYFINTLNTAGIDNKSIRYATLDHARNTLTAPLLWKILNKLTAKEIKFLNERIEALQ